MRQRPSHHTITNLTSASLIERPECIPLPSHPRGARAAGLRYERLFAKQFPQALHGPWFSYEDKSGFGYCQPDLILSLLPKCLVVFEVKYTLTDDAFFQLRDLYLPVVKKAMAATCVGVVVAKNLIPNLSVVTPRLEDAVSAAIKRGDEGIPVLHWVGQQIRTHPLLDKGYPPFQLKYPARTHHGSHAS